MKSIITQRLLIRDFSMADAADLHEILGDAQTMKYSEPAYDFATTTAFLASFCIEKHGAVAAVERQTQKLIGYILFNESARGVYEMGWFFNCRYWRQGYASEACKAVIDYAIRELQAHKLFAETIDAVASVNLMKKLGMTLEGVQRKQIMHLDGRWADLHFYGLLREEWENSGI